MDLLDEDAAILDLIAEKKQKRKKTGRKAKNAGLTRFSSLNKFKKDVDKFRERNEESISADKTAIKKELKKKQTITTKNIIEKPLPVAEKETKREQKENIEETKRVQKENIIETNWEQKDNEKGNEKGNKNIPPIDLNFSYNTLIGHQKKIVNFIFFECSKNGSLITSKLSVNIIAQNCNIASSVVKTSITRLKKKGYIELVQGKNGRGGWSIFSLPKKIYSEVKNADEYTNFQENIAAKKVTKKGTEKGTNLSSSSSVHLIKKNTTTKVNTIYELPEEWKALKMENLEEIGFRNSQLLQIYNSGTSIEIVSESLEALRHDIIRKKIPSNIRNPLGVVMKLLRVQKEQYHSFDKDYVSEADKIILDMMRAKKEKALRIQEERENLFELEFNNWKSGLSKEEKKRISGGFSEEGGVVEEMTLKQHFRNSYKI